eukprot:CCRYP_001810-RA/>CCRYP_001810-RA protein AED:0.40 eAED:0.40 QI:0/0/0/1/0/0/2/0/168
MIIDEHSRKGHPNMERSFCVCAQRHCRQLPLHLWCQLIPQMERQLNFTRQSNNNPKISSYAHLYGHHDYKEPTPLCSLLRTTPLQIAAETPPTATYVIFVQKKKTHIEYAHSRWQQHPFSRRLRHTHSRHAHHKDPPQQHHINPRGTLTIDIRDFYLNTPMARPEFAT